MYLLSVRGVAVARVVALVVALGACGSSTPTKVPPEGGAGSSGGAGGMSASNGAGGGSAGSVDGAAGSSGADGGDATVTDTSSTRDGFVSDARSTDADGGCDMVTSAPDFVGAWVIFNAMNTMGPPYISCAGAKCVWDGSTMTVTSEMSTCTGATLAGTFHWVTTDGIGNGTTQFTGTYDSATQSLTLVEMSPVVTAGVIIGSTDMITYDPAADELVSGSAVCSPPDSAGCANVSGVTWSARHAVNDGGAEDGPG